MTDLKTDLGSRFCITDLAEDVLAEDLAGGLADVKAGGGRHVGLDISDRLQANVASTH